MCTIQRHYLDGDIHSREEVDSSSIDLTRPRIIYMGGLRDLTNPDLEIHGSNEVFRELLQLLTDSDFYALSAMYPLSVDGLYKDILSKTTQPEAVEAIIENFFPAQELAGKSID